MSLFEKIKRELGLSKFSGLPGVPALKTICEEAWIPVSKGHKLYAHIHRPEGPGGFPGIVIVPGANSPGTDYDRDRLVTADEIASCGFTVLHYDPSGRGKSGGAEDYWGPWHQTELSEVCRYFSKTFGAGTIGIVSFSIGIVIASGALARFNIDGVKYLFDWEGPSNRRNTTKNDTHKPLRKFPSSDDNFWREREAVSFMPELRCPYFRFQAEADHVQGAYKGHAVELVNYATKGKAPWTRCNDNPENTVLETGRISEYDWVSAGSDHKMRFLIYLLELQKRFG